MTYRLLFFLVPVILLSFTACKQDDIEPSWLKLNSVNLVTNSVAEGENSHNITDLWVYKGNEAIGVFEVGKTLPILDEGTHKFTFWAGVNNNGISATKIRYPFYEKVEMDISLTKSDTTSVDLTFNYKEGLQFSLKEDFEDSGIDFAPTPESDTPFVFIHKASYPDIVQYGEKCGAVFLTATDTFFRAETDLQIPVPTGQQSFLELDYYNDNSLSQGFISNLTSGTDDQGLVILMNGQDPENLKWKHIYIELSENVGKHVNTTSIELYFVAFLEKGKSSANIYVDNIKVVHFP